jgi:sec-independent protein translocase protein TatA
MAGIGLPELIIILIIVVVIFGAKRIPEIMGGIGKGIKTFKKSMDMDEPSPAPPSHSNTSTEPSKDKTEPK